MKDQGRTLLQKDGTKTVLASLLSIVIGLAVGSILVLVVACSATIWACPAPGRASGSSSLAYSVQGGTHRAA